MNAKCFHYQFLVREKQTKKERCIDLGGQTMRTKRLNRLGRETLLYEARSGLLSFTASKHTTTCPVISSCYLLLPIVAVR
jgi:hypothetical protein